MSHLPQLHKTTSICLLAIILSASLSCCRAEQLPAKSSREYNDVVRAFYVGLAALQVGDDVRADRELAHLTQLLPAEPAGWANWGLLALRQRNFDPASERLDQARQLAPDNDQIHYLIGLLEKGRGRASEAIDALRKAIELNPKNLLATATLAEEIERQGDQTSANESQHLFEKILEAEPNNLPALLELARLAAKRSDKERLERTVEKIGEQSAGWPAEVQDQLTALRTAVSSSDQQAITTRIAFLRNVMVRVPKYRADLAKIKPPPGEEAQPFTQFLKLETPTFKPAPADTGLTFSTEAIPNIANGKWSSIRAVSLTGDGSPVIAIANEKELRIGQQSFPFPSGSSAISPGPDGIVGLDFNYDFKTDLVLAGAGAVRLLKQINDNKFEDVTSQTKLPASVLNGQYTGAWVADIDLDGDLDVVLGMEHVPTTVLRNNGDGSFAETHPFAGTSGLSDFVWADVDGDGDPDGALIDEQSKLRVFANERNGQFKERVVTAQLQPVLAICVADVSGHGVFDLLGVQNNGAIFKLSDKDDGTDFEFAEVARFNFSAAAKGVVRLRTVDIDNNGGNDLLLTSSNPISPAGNEVIDVPILPNGAAIWLNNEDGNFQQLRFANHVGLGISAADVNADGRLDLLGVTQAGEPIQAINHGTKNYHWQVIRPRAAQTTGDQRINSFGVGGEMEIRAGLLLQKQLVGGALVHFGLGEQTGADVVRIVWPNGAVRAEFDTKADQPVLAEQRLKGSCPFLFAYNGKDMKFFTDAVPWSSAIGLRINTLGTASVEATEEWYKIGGDELAPRDGYYDLRITAELWETYYYDHLSLMVVDHPEGTDVFVDERFVIPPAKLAITAVETPHKIAKAIDDAGADVTATVSTLDENYLDTFGRGRYQGVTRDHYVELDLGQSVPEDGPLWLIAKGWMHPTDSSINVAISQGQQ